MCWVHGFVVAASCFRSAGQAGSRMHQHLTAVICGDHLATVLIVSTLAVASVYCFFRLHVLANTGRQTNKQTNESIKQESSYPEARILLPPCLPLRIAERQANVVLDWLHDEVPPAPLFSRLQCLPARFLPTIRLMDCNPLVCTACRGSEQAQCLA